MIVHRWSRLLFCAAALVLGGCAMIPISSFIPLSRIDLQKTDLAQFRAGIETSRNVKPGASVDLDLTYTIGEKKKSAAFHLVQIKSGVEVEEFKSEVDSSSDYYVYRLPPSEVSAAAAFRAEGLALEKARPKGVEGKFTINVEASSCPTAPKLEGPVLVAIWLRTQETGSFVQLTRSIDMNKLPQSNAPSSHTPKC